LNPPIKEKVTKSREAKKKGQKVSKIKKKKEILAKVQEIQSRRTLKLQLCFVKSEDKGKGRQYQNSIQI
jgi:hypothetical protein